MELRILCDLYTGHCHNTDQDHVHGKSKSIRKKMRSPVLMEIMAIVAASAAKASAAIMAICFDDVSFRYRKELLHVNFYISLQIPVEKAPLSVLPAVEKVPSRLHRQVLRCDERAGTDRRR